MLFPRPGTLRIVTIFSLMLLFFSHPLWAEFTSRLRPWLQGAAWRMIMWGGMCALAVSACARTEYKEGVVRKSAVDYAMPHPGAGWRAVAVEDNDVAFFNVALAATIHGNATCEKYRDAPLSILTQHLLFGFENREIVSEETLEVEGREARLTDARGSLDGLRRRMRLLVLNKSYCTYDLVYIAPDDERFERGLPDFQRVMDGFRILRRESKAQ